MPKRQLALTRNPRREGGRPVLSPDRKETQGLERLERLKRLGRDDLQGLEMPRLPEIDATQLSPEQHVIYDRLMRERRPYARALRRLAA